MQEIMCPNCGKYFQIDDAGYAQILHQVRDQEFRAELKRREKELNETNQKDLRIARMEQEKAYQETLSGKIREIERRTAMRKNANTQSWFHSLKAITSSTTTES